MPKSLETSRRATKLRPGCVVVVGMILALLPLGSAGVSQELSRVPDFSGEWARPGNLFDFAPPRDGVGPGPLTNISGNRLVPVANDDSPLLKPWAAAIVKEHGDTLLAGRLASDAHSSCRPMGVPYVLQVRGNVRFLQTPDWIVITYEDDNQRRFVQLNAKHSANPAPTWMGESVGHYEGDDTLVIDCRNKRVLLNGVDDYGTHFDFLHPRWFELQPGVTNPLRFLMANAGDAATVTFEYYTRYYGA